MASSSGKVQKRPQIFETDKNETCYKNNNTFCGECWYTQRPGEGFGFPGGDGLFHFAVSPHLFDLRLVAVDQPDPLLYADG
jgi:hypothetical protein